MEGETTWKYSGTFKAGLFHGYGSKISHVDQEEYCGQWVKGKVQDREQQL